VCHGAGYRVQTVIVDHRLACNAPKSRLLGGLGTAPGLRRSASALVSSMLVAPEGSGGRGAGDERSVSFSLGLDVFGSLQIPSIFQIPNIFMARTSRMAETEPERQAKKMHCHAADL
jgi:hypothetical protein